MQAFWDFMEWLSTLHARAGEFQPFGIPVLNWAEWLAATLAAWLVYSAVFGWLRARVEARRDREEGWSEYLDQVLDRTTTVAMLALSGYTALAFVHLGANIEPPLITLFLIVLFVQGGWWALALADEAVQRGFRFANFTDSAAQTAFGVTRVFAKVAIWSVVGLLVLGAAGVEITPLLAGLGIGGIAVAFALQNILKDIFNSVAIVVDRPFEVGDFIIVGDFLGTVETIGIKTTRLRSLGGEQLVVANSDLVDSRIRNYKRMQRRRIVFKVGVTYDTPSDTLEEIPRSIQAIVTGIDGTQFDRAHFSGFGDSALEFETVYHVLTGDYNQFMDIQQSINLALVRRFEELGVSFAFPTRTLYLEPSQAPLRAEVLVGNGEAKR